MQMIWYKCAKQSKTTVRFHQDSNRLDCIEPCVKPLLIPALIATAAANGFHLNMTVAKPPNSYSI